MVDREQIDEAEGQVEFFGFKLRVKNPHLAALLAGDADVQVLSTGAGDEAEPPAEGAAAVSWRSEREVPGGVVVQLRRPSPGH